MPSRRQEIRVTPDIAIARFKKVMKETYLRYRLPLPQQLYLADSAVEEEMGLGRFYGGTSDIDILAPEPPELSGDQIGRLEAELRQAIAETGVDFNFSPEAELKAGNAYGRPCRPIKQFSWD